jgi:hypothetical protein
MSRMTCAQAGSRARLSPLLEHPRTGSSIDEG